LAFLFLAFYFGEETSEFIAIEK